VEDVRTFLGMKFFHRRLIPNFAQIAKPLTQLTKKEERFEWKSQCQSAFVELKFKLSTNPVLAYPDFRLPFILTTNASKMAVAAIQGGIEAYFVR
jgi:hypothetical protein